LAAKAAPAAGSALDRLPPAAKFGVGFVFVLLGALLYYAVFYSDLDNQITSATQNEARLKDQLAKAEISKVEYQKDNDEKTKREQAARDLKKVLPDDPEMPSFLSALQGVATIAGVTLTSWAPTDETVEDFYAKVPMKLTISGKYHALAKFFYNVGQLDRIINVENIQIKNPKAVGDDIEVQVECLATAFRSVKPGEKKKVPTR
jgi:type IV pilus assembly protein PilO